MSNYLNQIESDLYKLNSITNGSGEVVEMVAELKEKYEKAKAFDEIKVYMQSADDKLCDEEYFNEDVYEEYYGIIESVINHHSENESGDTDA